MPKVEYMSAETLEKLKEELHQLKTVRRREVAAKIEAAKALGDLAENAEYTEAKDELVSLEGRISQIEEMLKNVQLIEEGPVSTEGRAQVGSTVVVKARGHEKIFTIVGSTEADPVQGMISNESPIGSALLGSKKGDTVKVTTPGGTMMYEVLEVK